MSEVKRPLEGVKVLELATFIAAPCCARFLADPRRRPPALYRRQRGPSTGSEGEHLLRSGERRQDLRLPEHQDRRRP